MPSPPRLRDIQDTELALMLSWRNAPEVRRNMYTRHEIALDDHLAWWARLQGRADVRYHMFEAGGVPLGIIGFSAIDAVNGHASWAFYAAPGAPRGTGSQMELLALDQAFGAMGLHKLHCEVLDFNLPVIRLHEKFGFRIEGTLREHHRMDDRYVDIVRLGILAHEWQHARPDMARRIASTTAPRTSP
jgi:UDP-4-amino-4,6-dideoxy-N-acetyl-beta-L-altrosamine N-acetyltransferase